MRSTCKKLVSDIQLKRDLEDNFNKYYALASARYNKYSTVKMCMNFYTLMEIVNDSSDNKNLNDLFIQLKALVLKFVVNHEAVTKKDIEDINNIRDKVEHKMINITAYADCYEIYEYVLNRIEAKIYEDDTIVDIEGLSEKMFRYVFSENDTVLINSKLKLILGELPVRMVKGKFYDIINNTLSIYKGGEKKSLDNFVKMLESAVLISKPDGFETEYKELHDLYERLVNADYKNMTKDQFEQLTGQLSGAALFIDSEASAYVLFQEVVNDVYTIMLTMKEAYVDNSEDRAYKAAIEILKECVFLVSTEDMDEDILSNFVLLEGVQESEYENILVLEGALESYKEYNEENYKVLSKAAMLISSSLFVDLSDLDDDKTDIADEKYIASKSEELLSKMDAVLNDKERLVKRSIMSKAMSVMPIFLNSQQEIKDYFDYTLLNCKDAGELIAVEKLVNKIMED